MGVQVKDVIYTLKNSYRLASTFAKRTMEKRTSCCHPHQYQHNPVLVNEVIKGLHIKHAGVYVDMTFGAGGHTKQILQTSMSSLVYCLDRDPTAHQVALSLSRTDPRVVPLLGKFSDLSALFTKLDVSGSSVDGFLFDLGASSMQFDEGNRGFSLSKDGPLDMRMNSDSPQESSSPTAAEIVNSLSADDLAKVIRRYGDEKMAKQIADTIVETRFSIGRIQTTKQLADVISKAFDSSDVHRKDKLMRHSHVATKTFQALRIFVNNELNELYNGLQTAHHYLKPRGRCVAISFHSLEDRIVKRHFNGTDMDAKFNVGLNDHTRNSGKVYSKSELDKFLEKKWVTWEKIVEPSDEEIKTNPRARSAKLRTAEKL